MRCHMKLTRGLPLPTRRAALGLSIGAIATMACGRSALAAGMTERADLEAVFAETGVTGTFVRDALNERRFRAEKSARRRFAALLCVGRLRAGTPNSHATRIVALAIGVLVRRSRRIEAVPAAVEGERDQAAADHQAEDDADAQERVAPVRQFDPAGVGGPPLIEEVYGGDEQHAQDKDRDPAAGHVIPRVSACTGFLPSPRRWQDRGKERPA